MILHTEPPDGAIKQLRQLLREARWLWPIQFQYDNFNLFARIGKGLHLPRAPEKFWAAVSADQSYQLYINGCFVCRGPARGYQSSWPFDVVDLAPFLVAGKNMIQARIYSPGESSFSYICKSFPGFIFAAEWTGGRLLSDDTWGALEETASVRLAKKSSTQLFRQEHIDLALLPPEADPVPGSGPWQKPCTHPSFTDPWPDMEHRAIPMLKEDASARWRLLGRAAGVSAPDWSKATDVVVLRAAEGLAHTPVPASLRDASALRFTGAGADCYESFLLDFGRTVFGSLELNASGHRGGECVDVLFAESINENTLALELEIEGWNHVALGARLRLAAGAGRHRFYHPHGFRHAVVTLRHASAPLELAVTLHATGYPLEYKADFQHDNPRLVEIWRMCARTQEVCALDAFVDTPWREQAQWWGDARYQGRNVHWLSGDNRLLKRGIDIISRQRTADGLTYGLAPGVAHACVLPDFSVAWLLSLCDYYDYTGDLSIYDRHIAGVEAVLDYFERQFDRSIGLVRADPRYWLFLDWAPVFKGEFPAILSFMLLLALRRLSVLARLRNDHERLCVFDRLAGPLARGLAALRAPDGLYCDGRDGAGAPVNIYSCVAQVLAAMTGVESPVTADWVERAILPALDPAQKKLVRPNLHWMSEVFDLLAAHGHGAAVVAAIESEWGAMLGKGGVIERRDFVPGRHSYSHAWAAHPLVHLIKLLGGVRPRAPAWAEVEINPVFAGNRCAVTVPTPRGPLSVEWKRGAGGIAVRCDIPRGIKATAGHPARALAPGASEWVVP
jgi:hypothetical protein